MSRRSVLRAVLSVCLALLCMACSKKQPPSQDAVSEKQTQQTRPGEPGSVPMDRKDGPQVAATQPATEKAKVALPISDLAKVRSAAEQGSTRAQRLLGVMYSSGQGVPQDYSVAAQWFQKAAEGGDRVAYV